MARRSLLTVLAALLAGVGACTDPVVIQAPPNAEDATAVIVAFLPGDERLPSAFLAAAGTPLPVRSYRAPADVYFAYYRDFTSAGFAPPDGVLRLDVGPMGRPFPPNPASVHRLGDNGEFKLVEGLPPEAQGLPPMLRELHLVAACDEMTERPIFALDGAGPIGCIPSEGPPRLEPTPPERAPVPPDPPSMTPCPPAFTLGGDPERCLAPSTEVARTCSPPEASWWPFQAACAPIAACPPGDFGAPEDDALYVRATPPAATPDGSIDNPYRSIAEALLNRTADETLVLAKGSYPGDLTVDSSLRIVGACPGETILQGAIDLAADGVTLELERLRVQGAIASQRGGTTLLAEETWLTDVDVPDLEIARSTVVGRITVRVAATLSTVDLVGAVGVRAGATLTATTSYLRSDGTVAVVEVEPGGHLHAESCAFASTVVVGSGGTVALEGVLLETGRGAGLESQGSTTEVVSTVFRGDEASNVGTAIRAAGTRLTVRRVAVERHALAVLVEEDTMATIEDLVVADGSSGGVEVIGGQTTIRRAHSTSEAQGLSVTNADVTVNDGRFVVEDAPAAAIVAIGSNLDMERVLVSTGRGPAVVVTEACTTPPCLEATDLRILGATPGAVAVYGTNATSVALSMVDVSGAVELSDADVRIENARLEARPEDAALLAVGGNEPGAELRNVTLRNIVVEAASDTPNGGAGIRLARVAPLLDDLLVRGPASNGLRVEGVTAAAIESVRVEEAAVAVSLVDSNVVMTGVYLASSGPGTDGIRADNSGFQIRDVVIERVERALVPADVPAQCLDGCMVVDVECAVASDREEWRVGFEKLQLVGVQEARCSP